MADLERQPVGARSNEELLQLDPKTAAGVRLLADAHGDMTHDVELLASKDVRAKQGGSRKDLEKQRDAVMRQISEQNTMIRESNRTLAYEEPTLVESRRPIGLVGMAVLALLFCGLFAVLWVENGAAANLLVGLGALGITDIWTARATMASRNGNASHQYRLLSASKSSTSQVGDDEAVIEDSMLKRYRQRLERYRAILVARYRFGTESLKQKLRS